MRSILSELQQMAQSCSQKQYRRSTKQSSSLPRIRFDLELKFHLPKLPGRSNGCSDVVTKRSRPGHDDANLFPSGVHLLSQQLINIQSRAYPDILVGNAAQNSVQIVGQAPGRFFGAPGQLNVPVIVDKGQNTCDADASTDEQQPVTAEDIPCWIIWIGPLQKRQEVIVCAQRLGRSRRLSHVDGQTDGGTVVLHGSNSRVEGLVLPHVGVLLEPIR